MTQPFVFDSISGLLEQFLEKNFAELARLHFQTIDDVLSPLRGRIGRPLSLAAGSKILHRLFQTAESRFAVIAGGMSLDPWMSILRRFPVRFGDDYCLLRLTLGLIRYAAADDIDSIRLKPDEMQFPVAVVFTYEQLLDTFRLAGLAQCMSNLASSVNWVANGRRLLPLDTNLLNLEDNPVVEAAGDAYERRRPRRMFLHEEGFLVPAETAKIELPLLLLYSAGEMRLHVPGPELFLLCRRLPMTVNAKPILDVLRAYQDAIEDIFHTSVDAISHVLCALATRILGSIIPISAVSDDVIELEAHDRTAEYEHKLKFMFDLCQRAYLRFPRTNWVERLAEVKSPWAPDLAHGRDLVKSFFDAFVVKTEQRPTLDLSILRPLPFAFESPSHVVYIDLLATLDFVASILDRAKEWYSSQHGDRFTLALKRWIESNSEGRVVAWKTELQTTDGQRVEIDLMILHRDVMYVIECKAYAKSHSFLRGDRRAVQHRRRRIEEAVRQARRAAEAVRAEILRADPKVPKAKSVEWVVCTPTQEFLCPANEFGQLTEGPPRVCTPEELLSVFMDPEQGFEGTPQGK